MKASLTLKGNKNSINERYLKPAEKELENVFKKLKDTRDKKTCLSLTEVVRACWNGHSDLRPTALQGFIRIIYFSIKLFRN